MARIDSPGLDSAPCRAPDGRHRGDRALGAGASGTTTSLKFDVWSYSIPTIQDNIKTFQKQHPGVTVSLHDTSWFDYHDVLATRFTGGNAPDVAYSSDHWLREWVAAGWMVPLDKFFSRFKVARRSGRPTLSRGCVLDGKLYGLPYYADLVTFIYNDSAHP